MEKIIWGADLMAQWLKAQAILPEDVGSHSGAQPSITVVPEDLIPSSDFYRKQRCMYYTDRHTAKHPFT